MEENTNTFILRWNPAISSYKKEHHKAICKNIVSGDYFSDWSIQDWEKLKIGDAFILCQVGTEKDGIAAIGKFISKAYEEENRCGDGTKAHYADEYLFCNIDRDIETLLSAEKLEGQFPEIDWHSGHSGILLDSKTADALIEQIDTELKTLHGFKKTSFSDFLKNDRSFLPFTFEEKKNELLTMFASYNPVIHSCKVPDLFDDYDAVEFLIKNSSGKGEADGIAIDFEDNRFTICFAGWGQDFVLLEHNYNICLDMLKKLLENKACVLVAIKQKRSNSLHLKKCYEECAWIFSEKQFTKASDKMSIFNELAARHEELAKKFPCYHYSEICKIKVCYWDSKRSFEILKPKRLKLKIPRINNLAVMRQGISFLKVIALRLDTICFNIKHWGIKPSARMNNLSFVTEHITYDAGFEVVDYTGYFFVVDGRKLDFGDGYRPASKYEVLTDSIVDKSYKRIILNSCSCGYWGCDCCYAKEIIKGDVVKWELYGTEVKGNQKHFEFEKSSYDSVMKDIRKTALDEMNLAIKIYYVNGDTSILDFDSEKEISDLIKTQSKEGCLHIKGYENLKTGEYCDSFLVQDVWHEDHRWKNQILYRCHGACFTYIMFEDGMYKVEVYLDCGTLDMAAWKSFTSLEEAKDYAERKMLSLDS